MDVGKFISCFSIILLFLGEISHGTLYEGNMVKNNVLTFDMNSVLEMQNEATIQKPSRKKRDVSQTGTCEDQEQTFLQDAAKTNGFLDAVSTH